jgi:hypothetical protein
VRLLTFVLYAALLALIGILTVHEEVERVRTGYETGQMVAERERLRVRLASLEADLARLRRPERLVALNEELGLGLVPLHSRMPYGEDGRVAAAQAP